MTVERSWYKMRQVTHNSMDDFQQNDAEQKKPDKEKYIPYDFIHIKL